MRAHYWGSLLFDALLIVAVFLLLHAWQTRGLPDDEFTPPLALPWLDDMRAESMLVPGQVGVVYFFAPWCFYCRHSIGNLDDMVASGRVAWARTVALDYTSLDEVREFIADTGVSLPVLLGGPATASEWQVRAFPTYFVIDANGRISSRSVGYSTSAGLLARVWMSPD